MVYIELYLCMYISIHLTTVLRLCDTMWGFMHFPLLVVGLVEIDRQKIAFAAYITASGPDIKRVSELKSGQFCHWSDSS